MESVVVTGTAGFVGAALSRRLIADGVRVIGVDDLSTGKVENVPSEGEFIEGDLGSGMERCLEYLDSIISPAVGGDLIRTVGEIPCEPFTISAPKGILRLAFAFTPSTVTAETNPLVGASVASD